MLSVFDYILPNKCLYTFSRSRSVMVFGYANWFLMRNVQARVFEENKRIAENTCILVKHQGLFLKQKKIKYERFVCHFLDLLVEDLIKFQDVNICF